MASANLMHPPTKERPSRKQAPRVEKPKTKVAAKTNWLAIGIVGALVAGAGALVLVVVLTIGYFAFRQPTEVAAGNNQPVI